MSVWVMYPIPASKHDIPLIKRAIFITLNFLVFSRAKAMNKVDKPKKRVQPSMFRADEKDLGLAWIKCSIPSNWFPDIAHLTELISAK